MFFACIYKMYNYVLTSINNIFTEWDKRLKLYETKNLHKFSCWKINILLDLTILVARVMKLFIYKIGKESSDRCYSNVM